nr:zinc finger, CCHC-type [Tanacetum cinerariifolium]
MGDVNPIRTLEDYSKPSHEGYMNIIELFVGNNVVPLRSDIIRLEKNAHAFILIFLRDQASNWLKRLPARSITTWEDLTTRFLAQFFPPRRTAKLRNDILMFQQHQGESLSEAWTRFNDLLQKVPYHGIGRWLQIQTFYDHVSFHLKCEIDRAAGDKLHDKNADESWEIIENLALYDHEGWNDSKEFFKPVKAISTPQGTSKTPDQRLLELEDQINFLLKGSRPTPRPSSTHIPQAYAEAVYSNPRPQNQNGPPKKNPFTFHERGLKRMNALVDQGSEVNVMPLSTYMKLTDERPAETDIRLSLASYSNIYPLGIAEDVLVDVAGIHEPFCKVKKGMKNDLEPIAPTITMNRLVLEWEERIRLYQENEMEFDQWRSKNFNNKHPALFKVEGEMNEGEVT